MEWSFNELSPFGYVDDAFDAALGRSTLPHNKQELQHQTTQNPTMHTHASSSPNRFSTASTAIYDWSPYSTSSSSADGCRQLTHEILNLPVFQSATETDSSLLSVPPVDLDEMRTAEVPIVYDCNQPYNSPTNTNQLLRYQTPWPCVPESTERFPGSNTQEFSYPMDAKYFASRLSQPEAERNVKPLPGESEVGMAMLDSVYYGLGERTTPRKESPPERTEFRRREETMQLSASPMDFLEDVDQDYVTDFQLHLRRGPRSPHKKLFGENGWLGRTTSMRESPAEKYRKPGLKILGEKIKQRVEDITGDVMKSYANPFQSKVVTKSTFPISLDPKTQAKLYSEMELMICVTANKFLLEQYKQGRVSVESVSKVTSFWASKNRPQVIQFQFDQATQRDLILHNLKTFKFHGEFTVNVVLLNATLHNWKTVAKEMSIRTFCSPDSVIRKHLHDTLKILEMLGAPLATFFAFQELQVNTLALMKEEQEKKLQANLFCDPPREYHPPSLSNIKKMSSSLRGL